MTALPQPSNSLKIAGIVFGAPILFAFLLGASSVLIPVLLYRWLTQPRSRSSASQRSSPRTTRSARCALAVA
jgi:hypothetical protein